MKRRNGSIGTALRCRSRLSTSYLPKRSRIHGKEVQVLIASGALSEDAGSGRLPEYRR